MMMMDESAVYHSGPTSSSGSPSSSSPPLAYHQHYSHSHQLGLGLQQQASLQSLQQQQQYQRQQLGLTLQTQSPGVAYSSSTAQQHPSSPSYQHHLDSPILIQHHQQPYHIQQQYSGFDIDMAKRGPMDLAGGPDTKKARWSPTTPTSSSFTSSNSSSAANTASSALTTPSSIIASTGGVTAASSTPSPNMNITGRSQDPFANYGYGPAANLHLNTSLGLVSGSPNTAGGFAGQQGYGMGGMGMGMGMGMGNMGMGGFGYSPQAGGFGQNYTPTNRAPPLSLPLSNTYQSPASAPLPTLHINSLPSPLPISLNPMSANPLSLSSMNSFSSPNSNILSPPIAPSTVPTQRTVYVGNLPPTASIDELLNNVHHGPLEAIRILPEKSCVFLSFLSPITANAFHADASLRRLSLHGQELKIGWGKPSAVPAQVALSVTQHGASRNVYIGGLTEMEGWTEERLRDELSKFGLIDQVKIVRDKGIGFVHFLSIITATKVVGALPDEPAWAGKRVHYGKDRCAYIPKSQQAAAQHAQAAAAQNFMASQQLAAQQQVAMNGNSPGGGNDNNFNLLNMSGLSPLSPGLSSGGSALSPLGLASMGLAGLGMAGLGGLNNQALQGLNRTVYLGNIHPETTTEDLCNTIRGGVLQSIRYMNDKHIAFVTFVDPTAAYTFYQVSSYNGLTLNNRRLKIGWGKNPGPLPPALAMAVQGGATRNVYIGNVEDFDLFNEERLRRDFGEWGDVELVNFLKEKNCAFVNYTNIANAIKAIEGIKSKPEYASLRIAHGKDRCANPPRANPQGMRRSSSSNSNNNGNGNTNGNATSGPGFTVNVVDEGGLEPVGEVDEYDVDADAEGEVDLGLDIDVPVGIKPEVVDEDAIMGHTKNDVDGNQA